MAYTPDDVIQRLKSGEFRSLANEASSLYGHANFLFEYDPDLPAMLSALYADGAIAMLNHNQLICLIALFLAVVARMDNPSVNPVGSSLDQTNLPGSAVTDIPDAFRKGLAGLDLESL